MRQIRIFAHVSLDGVIQPGGPNENTPFANGWTTPYRSPAGAQMVLEAQGKGFDLLLGRRTYDQWAGYWPAITAGPFAEGINGATKYVATHRRDGLTWGPLGDLCDDVIAGIRQLHASDGADLLVWGSANLTAQLLEQGLVDELVLAVYPIVVGPGRRCFSDSASPRELAFVSSRATPTGVLLNTYRYVGPIATTP